jgi:molecular chaperone GrpE
VPDQPRPNPLDRLFGRQAAPEAAPEPAPPGAPADAGADAPDSSAAQAALEAELVAERESRLRIAADFANVRRRAAAELAEAKAAAAAAALAPLMETVDDLARAAAAEPAAGLAISAVEAALVARMANAGLTPIDPAGEPFDPAVAEAVSTAPSDQPAGTVLTVLRRGWRQGDTVVRTATVVVAGA